MLFYEQPLSGWGLRELAPTAFDERQLPECTMKEWVLLYKAFFDFFFSNTIHLRIFRSSILR